MTLLPSHRLSLFNLRIPRDAGVAAVLWLYDRRCLERSCCEARGRRAPPSSKKIDSTLVLPNNVSSQYNPHLNTVPPGDAGPCVGFAHWQAGSVLPSADMVTRRGNLRGLGKELIRIGYEVRENDSRILTGIAYRCCIFQFHAFIEAVDPDLHDTLRPYHDAALVEAHGEQLLDLHIRLASELDWKEWMRTSMEVAASAGNAQVFRRLSHVGPSISELCRMNTKRDDENVNWAHTLLWCAARGGSIDVFSILVATDDFLAKARAGIPPRFNKDEKRARDCHLLDAAAFGGSVAILSALLDIDDVFLALVRVEYDDGTARDWQSFSTLHSAARYGQARFVAALVAAGAPLEYESEICGVGRGTALEAAVIEGHVDVVLELLSAGAEMNTTCNYCSYGEMSPLCIAVDNNNEGVVDALLAAGADLGNERTINLPLHGASWLGFCVPLEKLLLAGANANWVDSRGWTALHVACSQNHADAVEILLRHNASVTSLCDEGLSPQDVVGMEALKKRQSERGSLPSTLDAAETAVADRICAMLRRASAWVRRGWLVMLCARCQVADKAVDVSSLTLLSSSVTTSDGDQTAPVGSGLANEDAAADSTVTDARCNSRVAADATLEHTVPAEEPGQEMRVSLATGTTVEGDENGGQVGGSGWPEAVEWLMQCPDEGGIFREVLSFV